MTGIKGELIQGVKQRVNDHLKEPFRQGAGPKIDPVNATKDYLSDKGFEAGRPKKPAVNLQGPLRTAYGPLNPPPTLKRPVVMLPGLTMPAQSFDRMANQLATNQENGPVIVYVAAQDAFRVDDAQGRPANDAEVRGARLFEVEYVDPWAAPSAKAPQVGKALDRIAQATGQAVDVVTHSAAGTDFRLYLEQRDPASSPVINRAVLIGPASHGTEIGNIGTVVGEHVKHVDLAAAELAEGSELVAQLNETWPHQRDQIKNGVTIIGTTGTPTLGPAEGLFEDGDGYMPKAQLAMPGAALITREGPHKTPLAHLWQVQYSEVVNATFEALQER